MVEIAEDGHCKKCGKLTIMYSYAGGGYLCLEHYYKFIDSIKIVRKENDKR